MLLFWLWLSMYAVLLGAEINAESEEQTIADTTKGAEKPLGERGAVKADSVPVGIPKHHSTSADMAVQRWFNCSPEQVFAVLQDGWTYPVWVVGASRMRDVDEGWPAPGTKLHRLRGVAAVIDDSTEVLEIEPSRRLVLEARGWPVGKARVEINVKSDGDGSLVSIAEDVSGGPARFVPESVRVAGIDVRNRETLRQLAYLAEGHDSARLWWGAHLLCRGRGGRSGGRRGVSRA